MDMLIETIKAMESLLPLSPTKYTDMFVMSERTWARLKKMSVFNKARFDKPSSFLGIPVYIFITEEDCFAETLKFREKGKKPMWIRESIEGFDQDVIE